MMKKTVKALFLFLFGGVVYVLIELMFRGYSHWTMFIVGGISFLSIGGINECLSWKMNFWLQCLIGTIIILVLEFISGYILNIMLELNIWDYSNVLFNIMGQICLPFAFAWYGLSAVAIIVDDWLRYLLFDEEKPHYILK